MTDTEAEVLKLVSEHNGQWSWYQLDRALTQRVGGWEPAIVSRDLMPALRELEQAGLIATSAGHNPGQPLYSITPAGQQEREAAAGEGWRGEKLALTRRNRRG